MQPLGRGAEELGTLPAGTKPRTSHHRSPGRERPRKGKRSMIFLERMREGHHQSDKHWNCFKGKNGKTSERWGGAGLGLSGWCAVPRRSSNIDQWSISLSLNVGSDVDRWSFSLGSCAFSRRNSGVDQWPVSIGGCAFSKCSGDVDRWSISLSGCAFSRHNNDADQWSISLSGCALSRHNRDVTVTLTSGQSDLVVVLSLDVTVMLTSGQSVFL